jgi:hypothetical protein
MARYLTDQGGSFEIAQSTEGELVLRQMADQRGIEWSSSAGCLTPDAYTFLGDPQWTDYRVSTRALLGASAGASAYAVVLGRIQDVPCSQTFHAWPNAYELSLAQDGSWYIYRSTYTRDPNTGDETYEVVSLAQGSVPAFDPTQWHVLTLNFRGATITALIDDRRVGRATDDTYSHGMAGLGSGWQNAEFDRFAVEPNRRRNPDAT